VKPFQRAIDNNRKLEAHLTQMRELACEILEATSNGVKRRKTRK
jgi:hypothetical protein